MIEPIIVYKETDRMLVKIVNDALAQGLPVFCLEALIQNLASELSHHTQLEYERAVKQASLTAGQEPESTETDETVST